MNRGRGQFCSKQRTIVPVFIGCKKVCHYLIDYDIHPENGVEILKKIKSHSLYKNIPVTILANSDDAKYVEECYANGANFYIKKPANLQETKIKIGAFFKYWMEVVEVV